MVSDDKNDVEKWNLVLNSSSRSLSHMATSQVPSPLRILNVLVCETKISVTHLTGLLWESEVLRMPGCLNFFSNKHLVCWGMVSL